jgi:hypothetical protein
MVSSIAYPYSHECRTSRSIFTMLSLACVDC